jgi:hypothetical protein
MKIPTSMGPVMTVAAVALSLAGCAAGGSTGEVRAHLSAVQCRDLADLRGNAPITHERSMSELAALRQAGYHPEWHFDPYYPEDLAAVQRRVDTWYLNECLQAQSG